MERRRPIETLEKKILSCPCNFGMSEKHSESLQHKSLVDLKIELKIFLVKSFFSNHQCTCCMYTQDNLYIIQLSQVNCTNSKAS